MGTKISQVAMVGWIWLILAGAAQGATTWHVDDDNCPGPGTGTPVDPFCSIQRGIDASVSGDEVLVAPGTYNETINFHGKAITLRSSDGPDVTIIDATGLNDRVVQCTSGEGSDTVLQGFTLTGGQAPGDPGGGGMYNLNSSPMIIHCIIFGNTSAIPNPAGSSLGGGMANYNSSPSVINCVFRNNHVTGWGGGGGMANYFSSNPQVVSSTFYGNDAPWGTAPGGGIYNSADSSPAITNCIFWGNTDVSGSGEDAQIYGNAVVNYSLVQGGWTGMGGAGNINADPLFVDPDGPDNLIGTQDDNLRLRVGSPTIDAGDNAAVTVLTDLNGNPRFVDDLITPDTGNGTPPIVDMGAYEFQGAPVPTVSEWGLVVMMLVLLTAGTTIIRRRRPCGALPCAYSSPPADGAVFRGLRALIGVAVCSSVAWARCKWDRRFASTSTVGPRRRMKLQCPHPTRTRMRLLPRGTTGDKALQILSHRKRSSAWAWRSAMTAG